jgi:hypothetical protein
MNPPDPTEEIRQIKRQLAAQFDNDLHRIAEETRRRQRECGRKVVTRPPRVLEAANKTNHGLQPSGGSGRS